MSLMYFAIDGNYGSAKNLVIVDSNELDEDDWDYLEGLHDWDRGEQAQELIRQKEMARANTNNAQEEK